MEAQLQNPSEEIKRLQRCINDLVSVLALPAIWSGGDPSDIFRTLLDGLLAMLRLDIVYAWVEAQDREAPIEMVRVVHSPSPPVDPQQVGQFFDRWLSDDAIHWPGVVPNPIGDGELSVVPLRLGLPGESGVIVAASRRPDFPSETERLVLTVASNQAAIGLREARLRGEQKRLADELDRRVALRTAELAAANLELRKEIAEHGLAEERVREEERELKRSEAFLREAQHLSSTGSFSWRVATDEITWSEQAYRIFEFEPGVPVTLELIGSRVHPDDMPMLDDMITRARGDGSDFEYEHRLMMPDGSLKYLHLVGHGTRDQEGRLEYIGAVHDVTGRRLSEDALARAQSELSNVSRLTTLGVLTASIAHEVNQPLSGIITNAGTCLRMLAADPPNVEGARETAKRTIRDGNRASDVIKRLRALFGKRDVTAEPVDLNEAAREVIALSQGSLQRSRVILKPAFAAELPTVTGDRVQLQQVILNLLLNATDAVSGVDDRPRDLVIRTDRDEGDHVRLSVKDAGVGLEPQDMDRLFEPFYTTKSGGMGIGLSVSRSIIESHQGRLWASANDGPGATFSFSIPLSREQLTSEPGAVESCPLADAEYVKRNA